MQEIKRQNYKAFSFSGMSLAWRLCGIVLRNTSYAGLPTTGIQKSWVRLPQILRLVSFPSGFWAFKHKRNTISLHKMRFLAQGGLQLRPSHSHCAPAAMSATQPLYPMKPATNPYETSDKHICSPTARPPPISTFGIQAAQPWSRTRRVWSTANG